MDFAGSGNNQEFSPKRPNKQGKKAITPSQLVGRTKMHTWKSATYRSVTVAAAGGLLLSLGTFTASAEFPEKPIEFVIPFGAGGGADIEGRFLLKK